MTLRRIFPIATDGAACLWYRLKMPLDHLDPSRFIVHWGGPPHHNFDDGDVVIGQRIAGPNSAWEEICADPKVLAVYDLDDDLLNVDPENTVPYSIYHTIRESTARNIALSNVVTVSTEPLARYISGINRNVVVLPNCLDSSWLKLAQRDPNIVTVGWAGSMFHQQDWGGGVTACLKTVADTEPRARFHTIGANYMTGLPNLRYTGWANMSVYFQALDFDIGLAPLMPSVFNEHKSWIKALEYAGRGIPIVAPRIGQYRHWVNHGSNGYLYDEVYQIGGLVRRLFNDELRAEMSAAAFEKAHRYEISQHIADWEAVYDWS